MYRPRMSSSLVFATLALAMVSTLAGGPAYADGGLVLPPTATPHGFTLTDMAEELALFTTSGNELKYYPDTPFQILYVKDVNNPTGPNNFPVKQGTMFFVPLFLFDDSTPIVGIFPTNSGPDAEDYIFDDKQVGADNVAIVVDGLVTSIGRDYVAGPVVTPPLLDAGPGGVAGTHVIQVGAFLTPLSEGTHTVTIQATFDGDAFVATYGMPSAFEATYTVIVN